MLRSEARFHGANVGVIGGDCGRRGACSRIGTEYGGETARGGKEEESAEEGKSAGV